MMGTVGTRSALIAVSTAMATSISSQRIQRRPQLLAGDLAARHPVHALTVRLRGTASNREASARR
jgi:hypothetical protein